jgi:cholesterol transport system auxiliary component
MTHEEQSSRPSGRRLVAALALLLWASVACVTVGPGEQPPLQTFRLTADLERRAYEPSDGPVVIVAEPHAEAGFDSRRMVYTERAYEVRHFVRNEWVATPSAMLAPLLVSAVESSGAFGAVVGGSNGALPRYRVDTEILALYQDFTVSPSEARLSLRLQLVDLQSREVVSTRVIVETERAPNDDPYGGVTAMNRALQRALAEVTAWAREAVPPQ